MTSNHDRNPGTPLDLDWVMGAHVNSEGQVESKTTLVQSDAARRSGFPILENTTDGLMLAWTHAGENETSVKTGLIPFDLLTK